MGKQLPRPYWPEGKRQRERIIPSEVKVIASPVRHGNLAWRQAEAFKACVRVGKERKNQPMGAAWDCAYGKNPREAVANAMKKVAKFIGRRRGAFHGLRKRRRS